MNPKVDKNVIGGVALQFESLLLDGSLQSAFKDSAIALKQQIEKQYTAYSWCSLPPVGRVRAAMEVKLVRLKLEVSEVFCELVDLIQVLKDVADMKYHALSLQKAKFNRFSESFVGFFWPGRVFAGSASFNQ